MTLNTLIKIRNILRHPNEIQIETAKEFVTTLHNIQADFFYLSNARVGLEKDATVSKDDAFNALIERVADLIGLWKRMS